MDCRVHILTSESGHFCFANIIFLYLGHGFWFSIGVALPGFLKMSFWVSCGAGPAATRRRPNKKEPVPLCRSVCPLLFPGAPKHRCSAKRRYRESAAIREDCCVGGDQLLHKRLGGSAFANTLHKRLGGSAFANTSSYGFEYLKVMMVYDDVLTLTHFFP